MTEIALKNDKKRFNQIKDAFQNRITMTGEQIEVGFLLADEIIEELQTKLDKAVSALEFYADKRNYSERDVPLGNGTTIKSFGLGYITSDIAQQTLLEIKEIK